jgi:hypothetical protein
MLLLLTGKFLKMKNSQVQNMYMNNISLRYMFIHVIVTHPKVLFLVPYLLYCLLLIQFHLYKKRAVWHQADPITKGTRWALVIFYKVS